MCKNENERGMGRNGTGRGQVQTLLINFTLQRFTIINRRGVEVVCRIMIVIIIVVAVAQDFVTFIITNPNISGFIIVACTIKEQWKK